MPLLQRKDIRDENGNYKPRLCIDTLSLTADDAEMIAVMIGGNWGFKTVEAATASVDSIVEILSYRHCKPTLSSYHMIVDGVYENGEAMESARVEAFKRGQEFSKIQGTVLFAKKKPPEWIWPVFTLDERWKYI